MEQYIWQKDDWPYFTWSADEVRIVSDTTERRQAELEGAMALPGFSVHQESSVSTSQ
ncbi:MAG: DUF4172 domain-containing protein [Treponema sp.]